MIDDTMKFFSIIIPVYNSEKYLSKCINTILNQSFDNYEIIIVEDGSTDNSGEIADQLSNNDSRIKVIHVENGGAGKARNIGIAAAKGEYILFIDSDDYIEKDSLLIIYKNILNTNKNDLYLLKGKKIYNHSKPVDLDTFSDYNYFNSLISKNDILNYLSNLSKYPGSPCTKTFKKDFLFNNNIKFTEGNIAEDLIFIFKSILYADTIKIINSDYYYYKQDVSDSVTHSNINNLCNGISLFIEESSELIKDNIYKDYYYSFIAYEYMILVMHYSSVDKDTSNKIMKILNKYKYVMNYSKNTNVKITKLFINILGFKITSILLKMYKKVIK